MTETILDYYRGAVPRPGLRPPLLGDYLAQMRASLQVASPAAPKRGDKVRATVTGYVNKINDDGTYNLALKRGPFEDDEIVGLKGESLVVFERAPAPVKVGDTLTGQELADTPWRRGTIVRETETGAQYVLLADGTWRCLDNNADITIEFRHFSRANVRVEYAPGK